MVLSSNQGVNSRQNALGMVPWIIMAPEILASASRCLPCRTQISTFISSGISVATGLSSRAASTGERPNSSPMLSS
ncbi:hypothetical protein D3C75_1054650 [compost metagenome]